MSNAASAHAKPLSDQGSVSTRNTTTAREDLSYQAIARDQILCSVAYRHVSRRLERGLVFGLAVTVRIVLWLECARAPMISSAVREGRGMALSPPALE
jgi:hypothetical protein